MRSGYRRNIGTGIQNVIGTYYSVSGCNTSVSEEIVIPSYVYGLPVKKVSSEAFTGKTDLERLVIGNGISELGYGMCYGCTALKEVAFPDTLCEIGLSAFEGCSSLTSVRLGGNVKELGSAAFKDCTALKSVSAVRSFERVGSSVLDNTPYAQAPENWQNNALMLGGFVLELRGDTQGDYIFADDVMGTATHAVYARELTSITFPREFRYFSPWSISATAQNFTMHVAEGNKYLEVRGGCLIEKEDKRLLYMTEEAKIPDDGSVCILGEDSVLYDQGESFILPDSVTRIETYALNLFDTVTLSVGNGLVFLDVTALSGCISLKNIVFRGTIAQWREVELAGYNILGPLMPVETVICTDGTIAF